ncbi:MAG: helix-turn-helix transcriptional regulator [Fibrobacter sp.]|nr:helix-turn-helix transcriptional regulator [Fibrobacter sp.]
MDKAKKESLEKKGWKFGDVDEYLGLTPAEMVIVEMKAELAKALIKKRKKSGMSQTEASAKAQTSQSRYAKAEHSDSSVSLELMIKLFFSLGADKKELFKVLRTAC